MRLSNKARLWIVLGCAAFVFFGSCGIVFWHVVIFENKAEGVRSVPWLPKEATDINYYFSYSNTFYEFSISEAGFLQWVKEKGFENKGWRDFDGTWKPHSFKIVPRYGFSGRSDPNQGNRSVEIADGIFIETRRTNGGGYTVGYDRKTGRAYYHSSPR
jgi:hypothetical protein